jgi:PadR family transcriptional regulator PadR
MALGDLEQLILFALIRTGGEAHGAEIISEIERQTGRSVSPGALYTVLDRLSGKGYVESWIGDSTPDRGGRRRRVYRIEPVGARVLRAWYGGIQRLSSGALERLDRLAEEGT